jgi:hypothetical protein
MPCRSIIALAHSLGASWRRGPSRYILVGAALPIRQARAGVAIGVRQTAVAAQEK